MSSIRCDRELAGCDIENCMDSFLQDRGKRSSKFYPLTRRKKVVWGQLLRSSTKGRELLLFLPTKKRASQRLQPRMLNFSSSNELNYATCQRGGGNEDWQFLV